MDIIELGAIGELVGGIAVVGSLIYVGLQVHQGNREARRRNEIERNESERQSAREHTAILLAMTDPKLTAVLRKGISDFNALSRDEQLRFDMWISALGSHCNLMGVLGELEEYTYSERFLRFWVSLTKSPGGATWWEATKARYVPVFRDHIDELRADPNAAPVITEVNPWFGADPIEEA
jgi:hypothetical protein